MVLTLEDPAGSVGSAGLKPGQFDLSLSCDRHFPKQEDSKIFGSKSFNPIFIVSNNKELEIASRLTCGG